MILPYRSHPKELYKGQVSDHKDTPPIQSLRGTLCDSHPINGVLGMHNSEFINLQKFILTGLTNPLLLPISQN